MTAQNLTVPDLRQDLESLVRQIPVGCVTTYGAVAQMLHKGTADEARPAHRVVRKSGQLSGKDLESQIRLLAAEGIRIEVEHAALAEHFFDDFQCDGPLAKLKAHQDRLPAQIELAPYSETPDSIAGVDLSYLKDGTAVACYAEVETATGKLLWFHVLHREVSFPYISGYLAYRELPILLELIEQVQSHREIADVVFVDGNGYLHPRRAGIASHLGVLANLRTVGVGKKLLCGKVALSEVELGQLQTVIHEEEIVGMAMKSQSGSRPVFVSPGHLINVANAARLARRLFHGHRVPEPIFHADSRSRAEAKTIMSQPDI